MTWQHVALPSILWLNTATLAASSLALEAASRSGRRREWNAALAMSATSLALGIGFLGGQITAWRQMMAAGVYLPTSPHSSFVYMLTAAHAVHVVAALAVLAWGFAATQSAEASPDRWDARMSLCRTFWHYLGGVWVFLFALVSLY